MENSIGEHAGRVWKLLGEKGNLPPTAIAKQLGLKSADVERAIGWLAREGKVEFGGKGKGGVQIGLK